MEPTFPSSFLLSLLHFTIQETETRHTTLVQTGQAPRSRPGAIVTCSQTLDLYGGLLSTGVEGAGVHGEVCPQHPHL